MKETDDYYHVPTWMSIAIDNLLRYRAVEMLKNIGQDGGGYIFKTSYGKRPWEGRGKEWTLCVWRVASDKAMELLRPILPDNLQILVSMAEEYSAYVMGHQLETTLVHDGIVQLVIQKAVEVSAPELVTVRGNFGFVGQLPENGRLRVEGDVRMVKMPAAGSLVVKGGVKSCDPHLTRVKGDEQGTWVSKRQPTSPVVPSLDANREKEGTSFKGRLQP